jgi:predicted Ser/Thr protein kinase
MATPDAHLSELSDDQRQVLESWVVDFDLSWDEDRLAAWVRRLPPRGDGLRLPALVEMIKIDLERRWQRGRRARLEGYVKALPELGTPDHLPADLLLAEYEARRLCGARADLDDFARRFPRQADELRRLIGQARDEARPTQETMSPQGHETDASGCTPASGLPALRPPGGVTLDVPAPVPERLGRYRLLGELGRGAMGTVYLAQDTQLDRRVALKVPRFTAADGPEIRQRFLSEARAAATIEHPNVCPVYDVGEIDGTPFLTMAYLQGEPLSRLLEGPALPQRRAASLVRQLTAALQAAHERGVIHRDLKPSNVLLTPRGRAVLLDFGLARRLRQDGARLTQSGQPLGTPAYMAPEQVAGAVGLIGPGCDVYALGVLLYQLLTGRLPFEGSVAEILAQIMTQPPPPPSQYRPDLDPRLEAVCLKALSKQIADRYACMRDFGAALAECLRGDQPPVDRGPRPRRVWSGRKTLWLLLAAGSLAAAVTAAVFLSRGVAPRDTAPPNAVSSPGTIRIALDGRRAKVEVKVDGQLIDRDAMNEPLQLHPGKHHLLITGKRIQPVDRFFTVASGDNPDLRVRLREREHDDRDDDDDL